MRIGEFSVLKVQPRYGYYDLTSRFPPPPGVTEEDVVLFEVEMVDFLPCKVVQEDLNVIKQV